MNNLGGSGARAGPLPNAAPLVPPAKGTRGFALGSSRFGRTYSGNPGCALAPPARPDRLAPGGGPGNRPAGLISAFGRAPLRLLRNIIRLLGQWQAGRREEDHGRLGARPSVPAGRRRRKRANPPRLEGTSGRGSEFLPKGSGNPRPLWSGELPRAESPAREPAGEAGEAGRQARRHMPRRRPRRPPAVAAAPAPPARSRTEPSAGKAGRRAPDPVVLLRNRSPPTPPRGGGGGERHLHGAVSPHSQKILVAAFPEDGRRARGSEQPAAVRTVSREATSRHSREGGSRPSKKAQGRRNVRSTRRWNHGRIAIATKTSLLAAVFLDPRAK
ncbi:serine/arginine repetitive matrix protein 3-like [Penaeus indicus]|uniref:serine/arginine repetitive matrix protein 3-like n=1 Tax=Penaeus indicus TaxID=29960 RepID=UPI00300D1609